MSTGDLQEEPRGNRHEVVTDTQSAAENMASRLMSPGPAERCERWREIFKLQLHT